MMYDLQPVSTEFPAPHKNFLLIANNKPFSDFQSIQFIQPRLVGSTFCDPLFIRTRYSLSAYSNKMLLLKSRILDNIQVREIQKLLLYKTKLLSYKICFDTQGSFCVCTLPMGDHVTM